MEKFEAASFAPPTIKECQAEVGEDVFSTLLDSGDLVAVSDEVAFRKDDFELMVGKIRQLLEQKGQIISGRSTRHVQDQPPLCSSSPGIPGFNRHDGEAGGFSATEKINPPGMFGIYQYWDGKRTQQTERSQNQTFHSRREPFAFNLVLAIGD